MSMVVGFKALTVTTCIGSPFWNHYFKGTPPVMRGVLSAFAVLLIFEIALEKRIPR
jgi:hypothetical protein